MLQFITHQTPRFGIIEGAVAALNGGCKWIQLRMKDVSHRSSQANCTATHSAL